MPASFYFLFKLYLFLKGAIRLDIILNLLFLIFIIIPLPGRISRKRIFRFCRGTLNIVLAFLLLWHDSWMPSLLKGGAFLYEQGMPSFTYLVSFIRGFFSMSIVIAAIIIFLISFLAGKYKRVTPALLATLIIAVPLTHGYFGNSAEDEANFRIKPVEAEETKDPAKYLEAFYNRESERVIMFKEPDPASPPFDIVFLHTCSLSWDDLKELDMSKEDSFFKQFDYLFTNFNTATGYSGPAVKRFLQANCGQRSHDDLSKAPHKPCLLMEPLASNGFEPHLSLNHDGKYGDFLDIVKENVPDDTLIISPISLSPDAIFFDKSLLYSDHKVLNKWFEKRQASKSKRVVFYYNSVLLHAGSHWIGDKKWYRRNIHSQYQEVFDEYLVDITKFIDLLKSSKRNTVLFFVPEHGRALSGSPFQPQDMRDIPLPKITNVPVGIKFIGPKLNNKKIKQQIFSKPTSYLAVSWLLARFMEKNPFGSTPPSPDDLKSKMPKTRFVSEHDGRVIMEMGGRYLFYGKDGKWTPLTPAQLK